MGVQSYLWLCIAFELKATLCYMGPCLEVGRDSVS